MQAIVPVDHASDVSAETRMLVTTLPRAHASGAAAADTHALGEAIASLAAGIHAATYRLLTLLREFDEREGWNNGFVSCAHWLHWRTGIDLGASREKVRVARALATLPRISWAMEHGALSYAKARALTRVATAENEAALLDVALCATAAHVERFVRGWRRVDRASEAQDDERRHLARELRTWVDDDGMVVLRGRLTPEAGAVVLRALEAASDRLFQDERSCPTGDALSEEVAPAQRGADALVLLAEAALVGDLSRGTAGDRYQVVLHVDGAVSDGLPGSVGALVGGVGGGTVDDRVGERSAGGRAIEAPTARASADAGPGAGGVLELHHGVQRVSAETSRRLSCDAAVVTMTRDGGGDGVGDAASPRTRTIPAAVRRALAARDRTCRFPGCTSRRCDAHHIEHWADGGVTHVSNLALLCRRHHRAVHEGGFDVTAGPGGTLEFWRPDRARLRETPSTAAPVEIQPLDPPRPWDGTRFDVAYAIDVVWRAAARAVARVS
jgi:hypothetical protein